MHDLRRLRAFRAVAERRSFSAAALDLGYAQSVVSHHVGALEREFGVTLVDRSSRPVALTDAGERLLAHAVEVLGHLAAAEEELRAIAGVQTGLLRVGAFSSACTSFVPAALGRFEAQHPGVDVRLEALETEPALQRLRAASSTSRSCGTCTQSARATPGWSGSTWPTTRTASSCHPATGLRSAVAVLPELTIGQPRPDVVVRPLPRQDPYRSIYAVRRAGRRIPAVAPMLRCLADAADDRLGSAR
jgi:DNA-binding transcriptional LysR family regulator